MRLEILSQCTFQAFFIDKAIRERVKFKYFELLYEQRSAQKPADGTRKILIV